MEDIKLTELELAWLAGLLEGEGSFSKSPPSDRVRPRISLEMTDEDIVIRAAKMFGVIYIYRTRRRLKSNHKQSYKIIFRGQRAVRLMRCLYPMMGERRKLQIDSALATYVEKPAAVAKLTDEAVRDIRTKRLSMRKFATLYDVAKGTIQRVQQGKYYKHIK